jgi:hypothetical protein
MGLIWPSLHVDVDQKKRLLILTVWRHGAGGLLLFSAHEVLELFRKLPFAIFLFD